MKHGHARKGARNAAYNVWAMMIQRCENPRHTSYQRYGGRGIVVCDRWRSFSSFIEDMGERPDGMTLDRVDPDAGYCKENCRWATRAQQMRNTSRTVFEPHEPEQARWLYGMGASTFAIADLLGVGVGAVNHVVYGGGWR